MFLKRTRLDPYLFSCVWALCATHCYIEEIIKLSCGNILVKLVPALTIRQFSGWTLGTTDIPNTRQQGVHQTNYLLAILFKHN